MQAKRFHYWLRGWFAVLAIFQPQDGLAQPLDHWHPRTPLPQGHSLRVSYGNGIFVAVGESGALYTSSDGATWKGQSTGTAQPLKEVAYGNSTFVAVGAGGTILTSPDGVTWTWQSSGTGYDLNGVGYGHSTFVAVGDGGVILTSPDGSEWTPRDSGTHLTLFTIAYGKGTFLAAGEKGTLLQSEPLSSPQISVSSTSLDLGSANVGDSSSTNLTVTNSGSANLIINQLTLSGANTLDFNTQNDNCTGTTLSPSQDCIVQIVFSPRSTGSKSATLSISSNDPDTPTQTVSLSGRSSGFSISSGETGSFCFISTSTRGSGLGDYIDIIREFRDVILLRSHPGRTLVDFYYQYSPSLSRVIARHDFLRKAVAIGLVPPLLAISYVALYTSPAEKAILFILMAGAMTAGWRLIRRSGDPRINRFPFRDFSLEGGVARSHPLLVDGSDLPPVFGFHGLYEKWARD